MVHKKLEAILEAVPLTKDTSLSVESKRNVEDALSVARAILEGKDKSYFKFKNVQPAEDEVGPKRILVQKRHSTLYETRIDDLNRVLSEMAPAYSAQEMTQIMSTVSKQVSALKSYANSHRKSRYESSVNAIQEKIAQANGDSELVAKYEKSLARKSEKYKAHNAALKTAVSQTKSHLSAIAQSTPEYIGTDIISQPSPAQINYQPVKLAEIVKVEVPPIVEHTNITPVAALAPAPFIIPTNWGPIFPTHDIPPFTLRPTEVNEYVAPAIENNSIVVNNSIAIPTVDAPGQSQFEFTYSSTPTQTATAPVVAPTNYVTSTTINSTTALINPIQPATVAQVAPQESPRQQPNLTNILKESENLVLRPTTIDEYVPPAQDFVTVSPYEVSNPAGFTNGQARLGLRYTSESQNAPPKAVPLKWNQKLHKFLKKNIIYDAVTSTAELMTQDVAMAYDTFRLALAPHKDKLSANPVRHKHAPTLEDAWTVLFPGPSVVFGAIGVAKHVMAEIEFNLDYPQPLNVKREVPAYMTTDYSELAFNSVKSGVSQLAQYVADHGLELVPKFFGARINRWGTKERMQPAFFQNTHVD